MVVVKIGGSSCGLEMMMNIKSGVSLKVRKVFYHCEVYYNLPYIWGNYIIKHVT